MRWFAIHERGNWFSGENQLIQAESQHNAILIFEKNFETFRPHCECSPGDLENEGFECSCPLHDIREFEYFQDLKESFRDCNVELVFSNGDRTTKF